MGTSLQRCARPVREDAVLDSGPEGALPESAWPLRLDSLTTAGLLASFRSSWSVHEALFAAITDERALYERPEPLRQPLIFYLAHPAAFYVNKLQMAGLRADGVRPGFEVLFAQGVDPRVASDLRSRRNWPKLEAILAYRAEVRDVVLETIESSLRLRDGIDRREPIGDRDPEWAILMGIEHERIHFETSSVILRQLRLDALSRPGAFAPADPRGRGRPGAWLEVDAGEATLGKPRDSNTYGWDDEFGRLHARVPPFEVSKNLITNREFLSFVEDAGYSRRELWSEEGALWRERSNARMPKFWELTASGLQYRATFERLPWPPDWPVEVNGYEAEAYCRWLGDGYRLPTELEWARLLAMEGERASDEDGSTYNLHLRFGSPSPVGAMDPEDAAVRDLRGNVWQWLRDDFRPLPGYRPHPLYADYSAPFFGREHASLRGGSWATTGAGATPHYRLWFRREFFQHAGFRVARDLA